MISALSWLPKGAAKAVPTVSQPTEEELEAMRAQMAEHGDDDEDSEPSSSEQDDSEDGDEDMETAEEAVAQAKKVAAAMASARSAAAASAAGTSGGGGGANDIEAAMRELDMEHYDDSEDDEAAVINRVLGTSGKGRLEYQGGDDPYVTLHDDEDDASEREDFVIRPTDLIILAAKNEDDVSNLEVWIYEEADAECEANLYVHHDVLLPALPLCLAWLDCDPSGSTEKRNLVATGTMDPGIEIWDLDVVDSVEPVAVLGGIDRSAAEAASEGSGAADKKKKKKKKSKGPKLVSGSHEDAVLALSWNREFRNVLASGSADNTVKVWDIVKQTCEHTINCHTDKVQAVAWNPVESPVLLTGAFDRTLCLLDARTPQGDPARWKIKADVEAVAWNPHSPTCFLASSEDGVVMCDDARKGAGSAPLFTLAAHDKPTCALSLSPGVPGLLATGSTDKKVKLWDISNNTPHLLATQDLNTGAVFTLGFSRDAPYLLAAAGAKGEVVVWDVRASAPVSSRFPSVAQQQQQQQQQQQ